MFPQYAVFVAGIGIVVAMRETVTSISIFAGIMAAVRISICSWCNTSLYVLRGVVIAKRPHKRAGDVCWYFAW